MKSKDPSKEEENEKKLQTQFFNHHIESGV